MSPYEKAVNGATKVKLAPPKQKYLDRILTATYAGDVALFEVFGAIFRRLHEPSWTIVFKSLIVIHIMIREGSRDATLQYLSRNSRHFSINELFGDTGFLSYDSGGLLFLGELAISQQSKNIQNYSLYLQQKVQSFKDTRVDYVYMKSSKTSEGRLRKLTVDKGLLREVGIVQKQIDLLLRCKLLEEGLTNDITVVAFRLLISDLLSLFQVINEGVINVLEHYFEMSRYDAERALDIYKKFVKQTADVADYLSLACRMEVLTRIEVPNIKHAPVSLSRALQDYLNDKNFEKNRLQYIETKNVLESDKKKGNIAQRSIKTSLKSNSTGSPSPSLDVSQKKNLNNINLIDFFSSIENEQTYMFQNTGKNNSVYSSVTPLDVSATQPVQSLTNLPQNTSLQMQQQIQTPMQSQIPVQQVPIQPQVPMQVPIGLYNQYHPMLSPNNNLYQQTPQVIQSQDPFHASLSMSQTQDYSSIYPMQTNFANTAYSGYPIQPNNQMFNQPYNLNQVIQSPAEINNYPTDHTNPFRHSVHSMNIAVQRQQSYPLPNCFPTLNTPSVPFSRPTNPFSKSFDDMATFLDPNLQSSSQSNSSTLPLYQKPKTNPFSKDIFSQNAKSIQ
ncbi:uncharacterized protein T551_01780 [Pneumocystis jirovecii RU7]|uniref:ENTH domain-containing protein n=1 Tax=Pneumocystis jirovecii (strain RU7) TaxID=1408657 RepID=A0A0W4ZQ68_PNEJ7|nr:uncharacterized protein T551_01780 [Pneumocystis jirovecii RU7]KTW30497.1 hypothetical protein T551_01780 [Pneumocystis jirovecii RU7]